MNYTMSDFRIIQTLFEIKFEFEGQNLIPKKYFESQVNFCPLRIRADLS